MSGFVKGSLLIKCSGDCDRLLNRCAQNGISVWDVRRSDDLSMVFRCRAESIYSLRRICRGCMCRLRVVKKQGAPFALRRFFRRPVLIVGLALCMFSLWLMGRCVWNIQIETEGDIKAHTVMALLNEAGLRPGVPIRSVRAQTIRNSVLARTSEIAFMTVNVQGTTAKVRVYERLPTPDILGTEPCDIISGLTGIITDMRIKQGISSLKKGQSIFEGQLIASGEMIDQNGQAHYTAADAEIDVHTLYTRKCVLPTELFEYIPTGKTKKRSYLIIGDRSVKLYLIESIGYKWYYKSVERNTLSLKEGFPLPVTLVTETYSECDRVSVCPEREQIEQLLKTRMEASFMYSKPDAAVLSGEFHMLSQDSPYEGIMRFECRETTGIKIAR